MKRLTRSCAPAGRERERVEALDRVRTILQYEQSTGEDLVELLADEVDTIGGDAVSPVTSLSVRWTESGPTFA